MPKYDLILHTSVSVEAPSITTAKAILEMRGRSLTQDPAVSELFGEHSITVTDSRVSEVKGARTAKQAKKLKAAE